MADPASPRPPEADRDRRPVGPDIPASGVAMITANYHPYIGGAEGQARLVAAELHRRGVPAFVLTRRLSGLAAEDTVDGVPVRRLCALGPGPVGAAVFMATLFIELLRRRAEAGVLHVHLASSPAVAAALAGRLLGRRVLVKLGGGKGLGELALSKATFLGRLKLRALAALRPVLVAPNAEIFEELPGSGLEGLERAVVPNGVDLKVFAPGAPERKRELRAALGWKPGPAWLSTSRLADDKRVAALLREFFAVWARESPANGATLYVAGGGPAEQALKGFAAESGAGKSVVFLGPRHDALRLYQAADVFLLPSGAEGMSNALLEAMACGLPALATAVSGTRGLVEDGVTGLLYEPGDAEGLRARARRLLDGPVSAAAMGRKARAAAERFSIERTVDRWLELYRGGG